jgi:hypothetical protein
MASGLPSTAISMYFLMDVGEDAADAVVDLVTLELLADFSACRGRLQDPAFAGRGRDGFRMMTGSCF